MKTRLSWFTTSGLLCAIAVPLASQAPTDPPRVLRIIREDIKEGKGAAHAKSEHAFMQEAARLKYPANILGMTSITGASQAWFLEAHDSFGAVEATMAAFEKPDAQYAKLDELDSELRTSSRVWLAAYHPELSYRGQEFMQALPKARYVNISIVRMHAGHFQEFAEMAHLAADALQKSMSDQPVVIYMMTSGMLDETYLLFEPTATLKSLDAQPDVYRAMGDTGSARFLKLARENTVSEESLIFAIDPKMSYVSKDFAAVDPEFWSPKPEQGPTKAHQKAALKQAAK
jgi:hypothetical protein